MIEIPSISVEPSLEIDIEEFPSSSAHASVEPESSITTLAGFMNPEEYRTLDIENLPPKTAKVWLEWGMRMYRLSQHVTGYIEEIKYNGHVIILDDGSRWEVDEYETSVSEMWSEGERVVVIDDEMFKVDDDEKVSVQPQS